MAILGAALLMMIRILVYRSQKERMVQFSLLVLLAVLWRKYVIP
ncbi:MAG: hypothetical protein AB7G16_03035 [Simkaniaceae bacterium]